MKRSVLLFLLSVFMINDQLGMLGLKINDGASSLKTVKLKIVAKEGDMTRYKTTNGNDLSVTTQKGKIVYLENDWLQDAKGREPLFSNFKFGQTTLREIRKQYGTNGFTYTSRASITTETDLIQFNCFEFDTKSNEILVVITKVSLKAQGLDVSNVADHLRLDAIIIADKRYLNSIWGEEKAFDPNYKKIKP